MGITKRELLSYCKLRKMQSDQREGACEAITQVFGLLGKRWSGLIIVTLLGGPTRFSQIAHLVPGVSERMLSERLSELTQAGLITRVVHEGPPVGVHYRLTPQGEALRPALAELERWGNEQLIDPAVADCYASPSTSTSSTASATPPTTHLTPTSTSMP
jgi:DNA-binding HxlR family transcriptional regulator